MRLVPLGWSLLPRRRRSQRYETRSLIISSNLVFSDWQSIFKDPMTTQAAVDRLVHHATILEMKESYRQAEAARRKKAEQQQDKLPAKE